MTELALVALVALVFWGLALKWWRYLDTRDLLEGLRPTAAAVAAIEAKKPRMKGDNR